MTAHALKLRYRSTDQVRAHYHQLKTGRVFIPTEIPLPAQTRMRLALILPENRQPIVLEAEVLESADRKAAAESNKAAGMLLGLVGDNQAALQDIERQLGLVAATGSVASSLPAAQPTDTGPSLPAPEKHDGPAVAAAPSASSPATAGAREELGSSQRPELSLDWIRSAVGQAEAARQTEGPDLVVPAVHDKKDLTPAERERIKPAGDFVMDLAKAMLRTGYYASDHPGSQNAKRGLYDAFQKCLRGRRKS